MSFPCSLFFKPISQTDTHIEQYSLLKSILRTDYDIINSGKNIKDATFEEIPLTTCTGTNYRMDKDTMKHKIEITLEEVQYSGYYHIKLPVPLCEMINSIVIEMNGIKLFRWTAEALLCVKHHPLLKKFAQIPDKTTPFDIYLPIGPLPLQNVYYQTSMMTIYFKSNISSFTFYDKMKYDFILNKYFPKSLSHMISSHVPNTIRSEYKTFTKELTDDDYQLPIIQSETFSYHINSNEFKKEIHFKYECYMICIIPEYDDGYGSPNEKPFETLYIRCGNALTPNNINADTFLTDPSTKSKDILIYTILFSKHLPFYDTNGDSIKHDNLTSETLSFSHVDIASLEITFNKKERKPTKIHVISWNGNIFRTQRGSSCIRYCT